MKIAVSSKGTDLDSQIDPRFGRCANFLIVETEDMSFEACDNENIALGGGAGIQSAQFVASKDAKAVITGSCGPNAVRTLSAAGIELFVGQLGIIKEAVEKYIYGELMPTNKANVPDHYGMGMSGRQKISATGSSDLSGNQDMNLLKEQAADLKRQMEKIESQINKLEKSGKGIV